MNADHAEFRALMAERRERVRQVLDTFREGSEMPGEIRRLMRGLRGAERERVAQKVVELLRRTPAGSLDEKIRWLERSR